MLVAFTLQVTLTVAPGQSRQQTESTVPANGPEPLVRSLYTQVVALHPLGIAVGGHLKVFAPYLSKTLLHRIDVANACMDDWDRHNQNPNAKPPGLEDGLFTGDDLRAEPTSFHIESVQAEKNGSFHVYVSLTREEPPDDTDTWRVIAIVIGENGHYLVDDVIWLKNKPQDVEVRLTEYLSRGCDGPHWLGYKRGNELR